MRNLTVSTIAMVALGVASSLAIADDDGDYEHDAEAQQFIHGAPSNPADAWILAAGGRIYDNWWEALDREEPEGTHPAYPSAGAQEGATTWRCKECHGWDYMGVDGVYRSGSHFTGIPGINGAIGVDEATIASTLRSAPHGYTEEMINEEELARLAAFVSRGQVDMSAYIDLATREIIAGDIDHGRAIFQTVCAACHGFDGRRLDWGDADGPAYVGTEAVAAPDEVLNKILNAHPGVEMVNLRAFGVEAAGDVLRYVATLPQE
jgi:mono/diheme cytochrome c family protein